MSRLQFFVGAPARRHFRYQPTWHAQSQCGWTRWTELAGPAAASSVGRRGRQAVATQERHLAMDGGRAEPRRYLGSQAGAAGRKPRTVRRDLDQVARRAALRAPAQA